MSDLERKIIEFTHTNNIGFIEGSVIGFVGMHKEGDGVEDINRAIHLLEMLKELEYGDSNMEAEEWEFVYELRL